jgi:hypothetical protein
MFIIAERFISGLIKIHGPPHPVSTTEMEEVLGIRHRLIDS